MSGNRNRGTHGKRNSEVKLLQQQIAQLMENQNTLILHIQELQNNRTSSVVKRNEQTWNDAIAGRNAVLDDEDAQQQQPSAGQGVPDNLQDRLNQSMINANISVANNNANAQQLVVFAFDRMGAKDDYLKKLRTLRAVPFNPIDILAWFKSVELETGDVNQPYGEMLYSSTTECLNLILSKGLKLIKIEVQNDIVKESRKKVPSSALITNLNTAYQEIRDIARLIKTPDDYAAFFKRFSIFDRLNRALINIRSEVCTFLRSSVADTNLSAFINNIGMGSERFDENNALMESYMKNDCYSMWLFISSKCYVFHPHYSEAAFAKLGLSTAQFVKEVNERWLCEYYRVPRDRVILYFNRIKNLADILKKLGNPINNHFVIDKLLDYLPKEIREDFNLRDDARQRYDIKPIDLLGILSNIEDDLMSRKNFAEFTPSDQITDSMREIQKRYYTTRMSMSFTIRFPNKPGTSQVTSELKESESDFTDEEDDMSDLEEQVNFIENEPEEKHNSSKLNDDKSNGYRPYNLHINTNRNW
jgi:hypothetical protein